MARSSGGLFGSQAVMYGLIGTTIGLLLLGIVLSVSGLMQANVQDQIVEQEDITDETDASQLTVAYNASQENLSAIGSLSGWQGLLVIAIIIGAIIAVLVMSFMGVLGGMI